VAYQLTSLDPLLDVSQCARDAKAMKDLGANTIRVYHVDPAQEHSGCMSAFEAQGIYIFVDLDTFTTQIDPVRNASHMAEQPVVLNELCRTTRPGPNLNLQLSTGSWTSFRSTTTPLAFLSVMKFLPKVSIHLYAEILLANTVHVSKRFSCCSVREGSCEGRKGISRLEELPQDSYWLLCRCVFSNRNVCNHAKFTEADIPELRPMLQNYMACGDAADISDFFSLNVYEWCGDSSYDGSGYSMLEQNATDLNIPIFISETGCRIPAPRLFTDQAAIFGQNMSKTWSGAIIYEWIEEANKYGLINYGTSLD